jgi:hypothetical protein
MRTLCIQQIRHVTRFILVFGAFVPIVVSLAAASARAQPAVDVVATTAAHESAARAYRSIWEQDGARIIVALEARTCMRFPEASVAALVGDAVSDSGGPEHAMSLRASSDLDVKRATLVHELAHRHLWQLVNRLDGLDGHQTLYLILEGVWADVWGEDFAEARVRGESSWHASYDYAAAWSWARALTVDQRGIFWNRLLAMNGKPYCSNAYAVPKVAAKGQTLTSLAP